MRATVASMSARKKRELIFVNGWPKTTDGRTWSAPCGCVMLAGEKCAHGWEAPR